MIVYIFISLVVTSLYILVVAGVFFLFVGDNVGPYIDFILYSTLGVFAVVYSICCFKYFSDAKVAEREVKRASKRAARNATTYTVAARCPNCGSACYLTNRVAKTSYASNPLYHDNYYKCSKCGTIFNKASFL